MPVIIPPSLRPPERALTQAQIKALRQPTAPAPTFTPEQQTQIQEQQETLSKIDVELSESEAQLKQMVADWNARTDIKHPTMITAYNEARSLLQQKIKRIKETKQIAQEYVVSYEELQSYRGAKAEAFRREQIYQASQEVRAREFREEYGVPYTRATALRIRREQLKAYEEAVAQYERQVKLAKPQITVSAKPGEPGYFGYHSETLLKLEEEIRKKYPRKKGETTYEYEVRLGERTEWRKEAHKIVTKEREEAGLLPLAYKEPGLPEAERRQLAEMAERARMELGSPVYKFMKETPTPLEYISKKIVEYDVPFFPTPKFVGLGVAGIGLGRPSEVSAELWKTRQEGEKVIEKLEQVQIWISEGLRPVYKEERITLDKEISKYDLEVEKHNKEIKELEKGIKEYNKNPTELKYKELLQKGERLDEEATLLERDYGRIENLREFFKSEKKKVPMIEKASQALWVGFLGTPVGLVAFGLGLALRPEEEIAKQVKGIWGLPKEFIERPIEVGFGIAGQLAFFGLTGLGVAKLRAIKAQPKITAAIKTGKVKVKTVGVLTESQIAKLKIPPGLKAELQGVLRRGGSIREYKTWIDYPKKTKYTPDVKAVYYEVMGSEGRLIRRISFGELKATLKGKTIDRVSVADAIEMLNKKTGTIEGLMEVVVTKEPVVGYDLITGKMKIKYPKAKKYKFYEEIKPIKELRRKKEFLTLSEATHELLGIKKYKGEALLKQYGLTREGILAYPDYKYFKGTGKPYTRGVFIEYGKLKKVRVDLWETGRVDYFMKSTKQWDTFGRGAVEFVKEPVTKVKPTGMRGFSGKMWGEKPLPDVIVKYPKPTIFKEPPTIPIQKISPWYGKQVLVPETFTPSVITTTFAKELPILFAKVGVWTGTVRGVGLGAIFRPEVEVKPKVEIREELIEPVRVELKTQQLLIGRKMLKEELRQQQLVQQQTLARQEIFIKEKQLLGQELLLGQTQIQRQKLQQLQVQKIALGVPAPVTPVPAVPVPTPIIPFTFIFPEEKPKEVIGKGYYPEAYLEATKRKKAHWKRLSDKPMSKQTARSVAARFVDEEISARGRIKPSKKKSEKIISTKEDYFGIMKHKFRTWKQVRGRRTKLPKEEFIERMAFRLDMPREIRGIEAGWKRGRRTPFGF